MSNREQIEREVRDCLGQLDGSPASAVAMLSGMTVADLDLYGGMPDDYDDEEYER